ncbi:hypothetical protein [Streptomyces sp. or20]|uniref:hypothetical protein n=1 Tax=Streptomyces sp. or20 TaxID=1828016 RepID=UPI000BF0D298|nr:hypothetical protein [Streptomyces sp. or20]
MNTKPTPKGIVWTTKELRAALAAGRAVSTTSGQPVVYEPRQPGDRKPWRIVVDNPAKSLEASGYYRTVASNCRPTI